MGSAHRDQLPLNDGRREGSFSTNKRCHLARQVDNGDTINIAAELTSLSLMRRSGRMSSSYSRCECEGGWREVCVSHVASPYLRSVADEFAGADWWVVCTKDHGTSALAACLQLHFQ